MMQQLRTPVQAACVQTGGSQGAFFFRLQDLPDAARTPGEVRDRFMMDVIGSAMSGDTTVAVVTRSARPGTDVDYLFGRVVVDKGLVDWSGKSGNLSAAVASFAVSSGLIHKERIPHTGTVAVRMWQANIGKSIVATVPVGSGRVQEAGDTEVDGVRFPAAEVRLEFIDPALQAGKSGGAVFPTGRLIDELEVPGVGRLKATLVNAGVPTMLLNASDLGYTGTELPEAINGKVEALAMFERIRACGALRMGLIEHVEDTARQRNLPEITLVAPPADYRSSDGRRIAADEVDLLVRPLTMGKLCHALPETAAVAIASTAAIPGTLVSLAAAGQAQGALRLGHPSGIVRAGADARRILHEWIVIKAVVNGSAPR